MEKTIDRNKIQELTKKPYQVSKKIKQVTKSLKSLKTLLEPHTRHELPESILKALKALVQDEDVLFVLRAVNSRHIITEHRASVIDSIIDNAKQSKIEIKI